MAKAAKKPEDAAPAATDTKAPEKAPATEAAAEGDTTTAVAKPEPTPEEKKAERRAKADDTTALAQQAVAKMAEIGPSSMMMFQPTDFKNAWDLALEISKSGIVSDGLAGNAGACFAVMARGALLGINWSVAVTEAYVVNGRISWPAAVMDALIDSSPAFEFFEVLEATSTNCIVEAKRHRWDAPRKYEVTIDEARDAGYLNQQEGGRKYSEVWIKRPKLMLIAMARREAARMWDPGRFAGIYSPDELEARTLEAMANAPKATAALEDFGASGGALPPGDDVIDVPAADSGGGAADSAPSDGRVRMDHDQLERIRRTLASAPVVSEEALEEALGCPLAEFSGDPGTESAALYREALALLKPIKQRAAKA